MAIDLILLHPPSLYDFRKHPGIHGPISDVVPSTPIFEMYPIGFASLSEYLERHGLKVWIINVALKMLKDEGFDVEQLIRKLTERRQRAMALLPELTKIGVTAIKIEGRQRSPAYVAAVTRIWRAAIDAHADNPARFAVQADWASGLERVADDVRDSEVDDLAPTGARQPAALDLRHVLTHVVDGDDVGAAHRNDRGAEVRALGREPGLHQHGAAQRGDLKVTIIATGTQAMRNSLAQLDPYGCFGGL